MRTSLSDRVRVQILGREYEMDAGGLTPLEVQSLATFVDDRMRDIANEFGLVDTQKIAVLTAVNIALDYTQLKEKSPIKGPDVAHDLEKLNDILSRALKN